MNLTLGLTTSAGYIYIYIRIYIYAYMYVYSTHNTHTYIHPNQSGFRQNGHDLTYCNVFLVFFATPKVEIAGSEDIGSLFETWQHITDFWTCLVRHALILACIYMHLLLLYLKKIKVFVAKLKCFSLCHMLL